MTKYLTVKSLIEELQKHPEDMRVRVNMRTPHGRIKSTYITNVSQRKTIYLHDTGEDTNLILEIAGE